MVRRLTGRGGQPAGETLFRRLKLAFKPAGHFNGLERVKALALQAPQRARSLAAGSQYKAHQRTALRASNGFGCPLHGRDFAAP
jgi:hypothetical protein